MPNFAELYSDNHHQAFPTTTITEEDECFEEIDYDLIVHEFQMEMMEFINERGTVNILRYFDHDEWVHILRRLCNEEHS
jgi:hypothetical protein